MTQQHNTPPVLPAPNVDPASGVAGWKAVASQDPATVAAQGAPAPATAPAAQNQAPVAATPGSENTAGQQPVGPHTPKHKAEGGPGLIGRYTARRAEKRTSREEAKEAKLSSAGDTKDRNKWYKTAEGYTPGGNPKVPTLDAVDAYKGLAAASERADEEATAAAEAIARLNNKNKLLERGPATALVIESVEAADPTVRELRRSDDKDAWVEKIAERVNAEGYSLAKATNLPAAEIKTLKLENKDGTLNIAQLKQDVEALDNESMQVAEDERDSFIDNYAHLGRANATKDLATTTAADLRKKLESPAAKSDTRGIIAKGRDLLSPAHAVAKVIAVQTNRSYKRQNLSRVTGDKRTGHEVYLNETSKPMKLAARIGNVAAAGAVAYHIINGVAQNKFNIDLGAVIPDGIENWYDNVTDTAPRREDSKAEAASSNSAGNTNPVDRSTSVNNLASMSASGAPSAEQQTVVPFSDASISSKDAFSLPNDAAHRGSTPSSTSASAESTLSSLIDDKKAEFRNASPSSSSASTATPEVAAPKAESVVSPIDPEATLVDAPELKQADKLVMPEYNGPDDSMWTRAQKQFKVEFMNEFKANGGDLSKMTEAQKAQFNADLNQASERAANTMTTEWASENKINRDTYSAGKTYEMGKFNEAGRKSAHEYMAELQADAAEKEAAKVAVKAIEALPDDIKTEDLAAPKNDTLSVEDLAEKSGLGDKEAKLIEQTAIHDPKVLQQLEAGGAFTVRDNDGNITSINFKRETPNGELSTRQDKLVQSIYDRTVLDMLETAKKKAA